MNPTPRSHPALGWNRLVATIPTARGPMQVNYPWIVFAVVQSPYGGIQIHAINERTGARMDRPCSEPNRAFLRVIDWARNGAPNFGLVVIAGRQFQDQLVVLKLYADDSLPRRYAGLRPPHWSVVAHDELAALPAVVGTAVGVAKLTQ